MVSSDILQRLSDLYGIEPFYYDIWGKQHRTSSDTQLRLLAAMGIRVSSDEEIHEELNRYHVQYWTRWCDPVLVVRETNQPVRLYLRLLKSDGVQRCSWRLEDERAEVASGEFRPADLEKESETEIHGDVFAQHVFVLPQRLGLGYHTLAFSDGRGERRGEIRLIIAPDRCYVPDVIAKDKKKLWGLSTQLYALRSKRNWGAGDFVDLDRLVNTASAMGAAFVGINPLHALYPHDLGSYSPYSPSSRRALNTMYIGVDELEDFKDCREARERAADPEFKKALKSARSRELVDYPRTGALKREVLEMVYAHFRREHFEKKTARAAEFREFVRAAGADLRGAALYDALAEHFLRQDSKLWGWPVWPEAYRDPQSAAVREFESGHQDRIEFFEYLQWQADIQLRRATFHAAEAGLPVGLYVDLALGVNSGGSEAWLNQGVYAFQASAGAPPDLLNVKGQVWGLPPLIPHRLREQRFKPFVNVLRYTMRGSGALRIDHVLSLMRLFWVPEGRTGEDGAYVRYPVDDLMGIVALESVRNHCLVVGEDLGTIPDQLREAMQERGIFSYKVLFFMKNNQGEFLYPPEYPPHALVTTSTHDLPTLAGYWNSTDLRVRKKLDLYTGGVTYQDETLARARDLQGLMERLKEENLIDADYQLPEDLSGAELPLEIFIAVHRYLSRCPCPLQVVQVEDLLRQTGQMNLPGTIDEHPNWRRRLSVPVEKLENDPFFQEFGAAISAERSK